MVRYPSFFIVLLIIFSAGLSLVHWTNAQTTNVNIYTGSVFIDTNRNGTKDTGEAGYAGATIRMVNQTSGASTNVTTNSLGNYTVQMNGSGTFCIAMPTVPSGYTMTTTQGPTRCMIVTGSGNTTSNSFNFGIASAATATPTSAPLAGNIININFGINNIHPWIQSVCGDIRDDNGFANQQPPGAPAIDSNPTCINPGIVFTGNANSSFGQGSPSSSGWIVGGIAYPEEFAPVNSGRIFSSYNYLKEKSQTLNTPPTNLHSVCTVNNCTLPVTLQSGIYYANTDVTLNAYTFPANRNYVFLIDGTLTIRGNIITPVGSSSVFSTSGNIIIPPTVGNPATITTPSLSGIFSTDRSFIAQGNHNCSDLRLNIEGTVIVNAGRTGGSLQNNRDLCANNNTNPTIQMTQRLDFVLNLPEFMRIQSTLFEEVAP